MRYFGIIGSAGHDASFAAPTIVMGTQTASVMTHHTMRQVHAVGISALITGE